jgi:tetratricopeptide (TPR) repeat protein
MTAPLDMSTDHSRAVDLSAFQAFRADLGRDNSESHALDAVGIEVLSLLNCAWAAKGLPDEFARLREAALAIARAFLADSKERRCFYDDHPATSDVDIVRLLAEHLYAEGRYRIARGLLDAATWLASDETDTGRVLMDKGRNARRQGKLDLAKAQFEAVIQFGRGNRLPEIQARGYLGLAGCAQARGNFEELRRLLPLALRASKRARTKRIEAHVHAALGVGASIAGEYGKAVTHLWHAYQMDGADSLAAQEAGCNLAQVLLESGRNVEARHLASSILQNPVPVRLALPLLGGFAMASARLGLRTEVEWATGQVEHMKVGTKYPREIATALVECAVALESVGQANRGRALDEKAEALAVKHGFYDLTFREAIAAIRTPAPATHPLAGAGARAAESLVQLETERPSEVAVTV